MKMSVLTLVHKVDFTDVLLLPLGKNTCLTDTINAHVNICFLLLQHGLLINYN